MTPERWRQVDKLLEQALEQEPGERAAFLLEACAGDEELHREVESLLAYHNRTEQLLDRPVLKLTAEKVAAGPPSLLGQKLGPYQIQGLLGAGGMGEVHKARDTRLNRTVAIKAIPRSLSERADLRQRFALEAKAASALNHPNIITVHDIANDSGRDFIVMEYVEGKTLAQLIPRKGMRLNEVLKIAIPIADALAAAHRAGIVHRDLKPGNVMVGDNGKVKVLDFGLAKLVQPKTSDNAEEGGQTSSAIKTETGVVLGTASYMSPEQAEGKPVDHRSDIFSFGAVLYEMVTGRRAFQGDSHLATLTAILREEPKPASQVVESVPAELDRVLQRCLRKDPERRFQSAADLKVVLQEIQQDVNSGSVRAAEGAASVKKGRSAVVWTAVVVAALSLAAAGWFWFGHSSTEPMEGSLTAVPLTAYPGWESAPSFSPDGSQVAFEWSKTSRFEDADIYIKQIGVEGNPVQLTNNPAPDQTPAWSPDGRTIAFARMLPPDWRRIAYIVKPQRGGSERTIAEFDVPADRVPRIPFNNPVKWCAWTADSKSLVVVGQSGPEASPALFFVSLETHQQRRLTDPPAESADFSPAVSPNGRTLAFSRGNLAGGRVDLCLLSLSEETRPQGQPERLALDLRTQRLPAWTPDGREIVFVSGATFDLSLWRVAVTNSAQRQRLAFVAPWSPAVSRQENRLAYSTSRIDTNIWQLEAPISGKKPAEAVKVFSSTFGDLEAAYSPDGRQIAFMSGRSGSWQIWVADSDGSNPEKLTSLDYSNRPRWSPDGQRIAFYGHAGSKSSRDIFVIRKDGSELKQLTTDPSSDTNPGWSADGRWIYFESDRRSQGEIWKVPVEGGEAVRVSGVRGGAPAESPDGKFLYYGKGRPENYTLWRLPTSGGAEEQVADSLHPEGGWVALNKEIYFISKPDEKGVSYIRLKDVAAGSVRSIAPIERRVMWGFTVSPDRRSFLYVQLDESGSDLMLVENFR